ncbi:MAG: putative integrase, partial [Saccharolobus sp.]
MNANVRETYIGSLGDVAETCIKLKLGVLGGVPLTTDPPG